MATNPLHTTIRPGADCARVNELIASGWDLNERANGRVAINQASPLILAAYYNMVEVARLLIANGASISVRDQQGKDALMRAIEQGSRETAEVLMAAGAQLSPSYRFIFAAQKGDAILLRELLNAGQKVDTRDEGTDDTRGGGAVIWASAFGNQEAVDVLLHSSIGNLQAALTHAIINKHTGIQQILEGELRIRIGK